MYHPLLLPDLRLMLQEGDDAGLKEFCEALHPAVAAEVLEGLEPEESWRVLSQCPLDRQVEIVTFLSVTRQMELVGTIDRRSLSRLLEEMAPDDRIALLSRMEPDQVEHLLPLIAQAERADIRKMLSYPEDSAGSIMTTEYAFLPEGVTVREALDLLRQQAPDSETIYYVYIVDEDRHLHGFTSLRDLILARPNARLADIMVRDVISVRVDDDQEFVAEEIAKYNFIAIPVVDEQNKLVGIITHDDAMDVIREEAEEDVYRQSAVGPLEDRYLDTSLWTVAWKRGSWLVLLLVAALGTASILSYYEWVSETYTWLVLFVPLIMGSGGNSGSQSAALTIRTLAVTSNREAVRARLIGREFFASLLLGGFLGSLAFLMAMFFVEPMQAAVVGMSVLLVVTLASVLGASLPLLFESLGMDPALMSNPLISVMMDVTGLLIYYNIALLFLRAVA